MSEYRRINLEKLNFAKETVSFDDAIKDSGVTSVPENVINGNRQIKINTAEKDFEKKCVKLEISY